MKRLSLLAFLLLANAAPAAAEALPGYDRFDLTAAHRARPIAASIWYPAAGPGIPARIGDSPIFEPVSAFMGPAPVEGRYPLVLLSHGSGGNADGLGWLSSALVAKGAMVLAVDHPGSMIGDSSPRRSADLEARAGDLSAALDNLLADPAFGPHIDMGRISVVGFSLGGSTALGLAGLRFDGAVQDRNCGPGGADASDCGFLQRGGVKFVDQPGFGADMRDVRLSRAVIIEPGFGGAVVAETLAGALPGMTLINLGGPDDRLGATDIGSAGNGLAGRLPQAAYVEITPGQHYSVLGLCRPGAAKMLAQEGEEEPICTDPGEAARAGIHARLIDAVAVGLGL